MRTKLRFGCFLMPSPPSAGHKPEAEASQGSDAERALPDLDVRETSAQTARPGSGSLIVLGIVVACILGMGALALKDWYPLISSPAFWNPPAREGQ